MRFSINTAPTLLVIALAGGQVACSAMLAQGPPRRVTRTPIECTDSYALPLVDLATAGAATFAVTQSGGGDGGKFASLDLTVPGALLGAIGFAYSAAIGFGRVTRCRRAKDSLAIRGSVADEPVAVPAQPVAGLELDPPAAP